LGTSEEKPTTVVILLQKDKKMETANTQNSTFANRTSRHTTKSCKRALFLPSHRSIPIHLMYLADIFNTLIININDR
ncbi:MAG TPA: hypothetical protein PLB43_05700, partial [Prolixibacteraceae bacterium]|nr:hypothetical protein [Prolixibacteraceae bacterium]HOS00123.1 hypothetical protein [Prolixibacteraceae bacterium]HOS91259.1 hypothetical protein [Prolixibacteraceae bacterium]HPL45405.1 hypothetical protein [Prolixibacteraceae bacterium]